MPKFDIHIMPPFLSFFNESDFPEQQASALLTGQVGGGCTDRGAFAVVCPHLSQNNLKKYACVRACVRALACVSRFLTHAGIDGK